MKIRMYEDVEDFITIGGKKIPTNTARYSDTTSYDDISRDFTRRYNADVAEKERVRKEKERQEVEEKERARREKERQEKEARAQAEFDKNFSKYLDEAGNPLDCDELFEALWDEYVSSQGKCDTVGGEILRAFGKINYRFYNDGDMFTLFSVDSCDEAAGYLYLSKNVPSAIKESIKNFDGCCEERYYEKCLKNLEKVVLNTLCANPYLFGEENNEDMFDFDCSDTLKEGFDQFTFDFVYDEEIDKYGKNTIEDALNNIIDDVAWSLGIQRYVDMTRGWGGYGVTGVPYSKSDEFYEEVESQYNDWIEEREDEESDEEDDI